MLGTHFAQQFRQAYFGDNWAGAALMPWLRKLSFDKAFEQHSSFEQPPIHLAAHISYYTRKLNEVFQGMPLSGTDADSLEWPIIKSEEDWIQWLILIEKEAKEVSDMLEIMPDEAFYLPFANSGYGTVLKNVSGTLDHLYYHLGQLVWQIKAVSID